jgi:hypothetical protein
MQKGQQASAVRQGSPRGLQEAKLTFCPQGHHAPEVILGLPTSKTTYGIPADT